nr:hypothetical protein [Tanacetum cinerariifolium]
MIRLGLWDEDSLHRSALPVSSSGCVTSLSKCVVTCSSAMYSGVCSPAYGDVRHNVSGTYTNVSPQYCVIRGMSGSEPTRWLRKVRRPWLPSRYIRLYIEQLKQGGLRIPFSSLFLAVIRHFGVHVSQLVPMGVNRVILFEIRCISLSINLTVSLFWVFYKLCKQGHWFSFENKTGRGTKKYFKEVTSSLKGWEKKIFLLDRRAILDAMPWRHGDIVLHDDFLTNYNEIDVSRLSKFLVPLRPPPCHLLYVCGLTTACRHPELQYNIRDQDKNVISMDTFLKLPTWTGTIVSKGHPISEEQRPKPRVTPQLAVGVEIPEQLPSKRTWRNRIPKLLSLGRRRINRCLPRKRLNVMMLGMPRVRERSRGFRNITSRLNLAQKRLFRLPLYTSCSEIHSSLSSHQGDEDEMVNNRHDYQTLGQFVVAQGELLKRHDQLNHDYVDLQNRGNVHLVELDRLRSSLQRVTQDNEGLTNKLNLLDSAYSKCSFREKELVDRVKYLERERNERRTTASDQIRVLKCEKLSLSAEVAQAKADHQKLVREFIPAVVKRLHASVEYRQSLAAPVSLCFIAGWLGGLSLDSYLFLVAGLMKVSPDVPTHPLANEVGDPNAYGTDDVARISPPPTSSSRRLLQMHLLVLLLDVTGSSLLGVLGLCNRICFGMNRCN